VQDTRLIHVPVSTLVDFTVTTRLS